MIEIYINCFPSKLKNNVWDCPENKGIASEWLPKVYKWIFEKEKDCQILTWTDSLVNSIGWAIEEGILSKDEVVVYFENHDPFYYDDRGILQWNLFGYFYADEYLIKKELGIL